MLDEESDAILRWTPNGRAFEIHDMDRMMDAVLPKYFKHRKYTSFQRQLNYFNFRKWTKSKAVVCTFSNDCFVRDQPELACRITRKKSLHGHGYSHASRNSSAGSIQQLASPKPRPSRALSMPTPHVHVASTTSPYWLKGEGVAISVPRTSSAGDLGRAPFPSPTDQDMMLKEHDHAATSHHGSSSRRHYYAYPLQLHASHVHFAYQQQHAPQPPSSQYGAVQLSSQYCATSQLPPSQQQSPESLDWIDCLLPPVDRIEDEIYSYMYPPPAVATSMSTSSSLLSSDAKSYEFTSTSL